MSEFRYKAFISYSHKNSRHAAWLMNKLETYPIPPHIDGSRAAPRIGRIFRDREELSASGSMDADIANAIASSEFLIVICSRDASRSRRVNSEIRQFVSARNSSNILCYIVDGEPNFETTDLNNDPGCIPPELRKLRLISGQTPLAADARPIGDGRKNAVSKLLAGLLGVNLDELLRRDLKRKNRKLTFIAAAATAFGLVAVGLLIRANAAEKEAQLARIEAQLQQTGAEDLVSFMLDDLVGFGLQKLGRVDVLDAVVGKIVDHYEKQDDSKMTTEALGRKAQAYMQLGKLYLGRDLRDPARDLFNYAFETTEAIYARQPDASSAIFDHAFSLYWVGLNHIFNGRYGEAEKAWRERLAIGERLWERDQLPFHYWYNMADMNIHLGWSLLELGRKEEALVQFERGLERRMSNVARFPEDIGFLNPLGGGHYYVQWGLLSLGRNEEALRHGRESYRLYQYLTEEDPQDNRAKGNYARSLRWLADLEIAVGLSESAMEHLKKSIAIHKELLDFEPDNTTFQYQECVSLITLSELLWRQGEKNAAREWLQKGCTKIDQTLSLDHFKVHHRLYSYRRVILELEMIVADENAIGARQLYTSLESRWGRETEEIRHSSQGQRIDLELGIQAVNLNFLDGSIPTAANELSAAIARMREQGVDTNPATASQISRAEQALALTSIASARAK